MLSSPETTTGVSRAIQLALGPVFLLTGIAGLLNVMSGRLSRIIDRGRALTGNQSGLSATAKESEDLKLRLQKLERRRHYTSIAITACTIAALLVCIDIMALFTEVMLGIEIGGLIAVLFSLAVLALVIGLSYFLREVHQAAQTIRIS